MKIWHISDTHVLHRMLRVPENVDLVVHSGDAANDRDVEKNIPEFRSFLDWFSQLPAKYKVFVPGNHDVAVAAGVFKKKAFLDRNIILLNETSVEIDGLKFYGSPWVPRFGDWPYMADRGSFTKRWARIPDDTDILVTHTPPFGVLDATYGKEEKYKLTGCKALQKRVFSLRLKAHFFGHVHDSADIPNTGVRKLPSRETLFSNGSCCEDRRTDTVKHHGNLLEVT